MPPTVTACTDHEFPFPELVRLVRPNATGFDPRPCPDRLVGTLDYVAEQQTWADAAANPVERNLTSPAVLLVMESPHKDEFKLKDSYTPWPANGATGVRIREFAGCLLPEAWDPSTSQIVLINAIPFQCSLGVSTQHHRDAVFKAVWAAGGRALFQARLRRWYQRGDLVVNACTKGATEIPLRQEVEDAIDELLPSSLRLRRQHPFSWMTDDRARRAW